MVVRAGALEEGTAWAEVGLVEVAMGVVVQADLDQTLLQEAQEQQIQVLVEVASVLLQLLIVLEYQQHHLYYMWLE